MTQRFIDHHINFKRLFAEAVRDSIIDNYPRDKIEPGYYLIRLGRERPLVVASRIYWRDFEPGDEANKLDRWPIPVLAGEMLGEYCDPVLVWTGRDRRRLTLPDDGRAWTIEGYYRYLCADADHARAWRPEEPVAAPYRQVDLTKVPPIRPPVFGKRDK